MKLSTKLACVIAMLAIVLIAAVPAGADTGKPSVTVGDVTVSPSVFMPGDTGTITIKITNPINTLAGETTSDSNTYNYGTGTSGQVSIGHTQTTTTTSTNTPDGAVYLKEVSLVADAPIHVTSAQQFLDGGRLGMGNSMPFTFTIQVDNNIPDGMYPMTLKIRTDDSGIYLNYPISLQVSGISLKAVINDAPASFSTAKKSVVLDITNLRPNGVTGVSVVPSGDDFTFKPQQEYVVGSIGAGELYTVQFDVTAKNASFKGNPSFKVVYMNGQNWHETSPITIYSDHSAAAAAPANAGDNSLLYLGLVVVVAILALAGIFMYMRGKRAKR
ncbi:MAG TPA: hypothetical protein VMC84_07685 [Methanocella sp.]|uniref:hypothetical protein n=1 Tax=Methanocella sp. TaxID=2052833 RepID=UPI002C4835D6|nr:hypothetical protein [Methanocella sp.]HTY91040.1 hypothetical protein [Methanocella sp.]